MLLRADGGERAAEEQLGGLYERVAKLALDHHAAFEEEQEQEQEAEDGAQEEEQEQGDNGDGGIAAPFPTLADGRSRWVGWGWVGIGGWVGWLQNVEPIIEHDI